MDVLRERMKAGVQQFPLHPAVAIQRAMKYVLVQYVRLPAPEFTMKLEQLGQQLALPDLLKDVL